MSVGRIEPERLSRLRAASQLLHRPPSAREAGEVAREIGGAQAQEKRAGLLQFRARSRRLTAAAVEGARAEERSLVRGWLMRGTLHLVAAEDYRWMLPLWSARHAANARRRLGQLGMSASKQERALRVIETALGSEGVLARGELIGQLASAGVKLTPEMRVHMMALPVVEGLACVGPDEGRRGSLVLAADWLGGGRKSKHDRESALAELARRYLGAFAPATERDFAFWSGLPLRECRLGLDRIAPELVDLGGARSYGNMLDLSSGTPEAGPLLALKGKLPRASRSPLVRLLPAFDTYLMGYASRGHAVGKLGERRILPGGGVLRPTICVDGRLVGLWSSRRNGSRMTVSLEPFEPLEDEISAAIAAEVEDLGRFEGTTAALA